MVLASKLYTKSHENLFYGWDAFSKRLLAKTMMRKGNNTAKGIKITFEETEQGYFITYIEIYTVLEFRPSYNWRAESNGTGLHVTNTILVG